ncbi:CoA ester lyase [Streptomyces sp. AC555_RSS877]|uniref:HpcH/HpaI aldolase/citrate lyase family protein n=1 Tax=Streptomyces sp. AC555_RSS877 TaxID=2823688 RepID=UPI0027E5A303|nr:CoA ester lyase [Streptomyces sp. AC555_RSS877]
MSRHGTRPVRSWLITPAMAADRFGKARTSSADVALVDLEDSVARAHKAAARKAAQHFFLPETSPAPAPMLGLRLNSPLTADGVRDLAAIADYPTRPPLVLVPKTETARDIEMVAGVLDTGDHTPEIYALIETPRGIEQLPSILRADRLGGLLFGAADYAALVGCALGWEALLYARSAVANSAGTAGIPAIDSPYFDLHDLDGLKLECQRAKELGFLGKGAVHPAHLPVITSVFTPSQDEIAAAHAIVAAGQEAHTAVTTVGSQMVGPPFVAAAQSLAARAATASH